MCLHMCIQCHKWCDVQVLDSCAQCSALLGPNFNTAHSWLNPEVWFKAVTICNITIAVVARAWGSLSAQYVDICSASCSNRLGTHKLLQLSEVHGFHYWRVWLYTVLEKLCWISPAAVFLVCCACLYHTCVWIVTVINLCCPCTKYIKDPLMISVDLFTCLITSLSQVLKPSTMSTFSTGIWQLLKQASCHDSRFPISFTWEGFCYLYNSEMAVVVCWGWDL